MGKFRKALKSVGYECLRYEKMYPIEEGGGGLLPLFEDVSTYDNSIEGGICTVKHDSWGEDTFLLVVWKDIGSSDSIFGRLNSRCGWGTGSSEDGVAGAKWTIEGIRPGPAEELATALSGRVVHVDC